MTTGSHQKTIGKNDERFTPQWLWRPLGPFATDAAAAVVRPWSIGRYRNITAADNCLTMNWRAFRRTWLNPPFNRFGVDAFVSRMVAHDHGTLLLHVRTETQWFAPIWDAAAAILFVAGRVIFCNRDGSPCTIEDPDSKHYGKAANSGAGVLLAAFGAEDMDRLAAVATAPVYDGGRLIRPAGEIPGKFVPLKFPRSVLAMFIGTWRQAIAARFPDGEFGLDDLYREFASHPKAAANKHAREKLRQTVARGGFERVGRGRYRTVAV
jgi:hypothetical protein